MTLYNLVCVIVEYVLGNLRLRLEEHVKLLRKNLGVTLCSFISSFL